MNSLSLIRWVVKPLVFAAALLPLAALIERALHGNLGANPIETLNRATGDWTLRFLLIALAVTPLRRLTGWHMIMRLRRMLGLFAFFYAVVHFLTWVWIDQQFEWRAIVEDIAKRPFITLGFACLVLLLPLAVTSNQTMMRRLGGQRWQRLHRLVYAIAVGGVVHYWWLVKSDIREPLLYGAILAVLFAVRLWYRRRAVVAAAAR